MGTDVLNKLAARRAAAAQQQADALDAAGMRYWQRVTAMAEGRDVAESVVQVEADLRALGLEIGDLERDIDAVRRLHRLRAGELLAATRTRATTAQREHQAAHEAEIAARAAHVEAEARRRAAAVAELDAVEAVAEASRRHAADMVSAGKLAAALRNRGFVEPEAARVEAAPIRTVRVRVLEKCFVGGQVREFGEQFDIAEDQVGGPLEVVTGPPRRYRYRARRRLHLDPPRGRVVQANEVFELDAPLSVPEVDLVGDDVPVGLPPIDYGPAANTDRSAPVGLDRRAVQLLDQITMGDREVRE